MITGVQTIAILSLSLSLSLSLPPSLSHTCSLTTPTPPPPPPPPPTHTHLYSNKIFEVLLLLYEHVPIHVCVHVHIMAIFKISCMHNNINVTGNFTNLVTLIYIAKSFKYSNGSACNNIIISIHVHLPVKGTSVRDWAGFEGAKAFMTDSFTLPAMKSLHRKGHLPAQCSKCEIECV